LDDKQYKLIFSASSARKIMKLGRCFPVDIKEHKNPKEIDRPSVFVFKNVDDKEFKVICNPARARNLLKEGFKLVDIKVNLHPRDTDSPTIFVFEITEEFIKDFAKICEEENYNLGGN